MNELRTPTARARARRTTCVGLLLCAVGIGMLWLSGVDFPVALPPGGENTAASSRSEIVFLALGTLFVVWDPWRWAPLVGVLFGAVFTVGFIATPVGLDNLLGGAGPGVAVAQGTQLLGELVALAAGVVALRATDSASDDTQS